MDATCRGNLFFGRFVSVTGPTRITSYKEGITIGNFVSIAPFVTIQEHYHRSDGPTTYFIHKNVIAESGPDLVSKGPIVIEDDVWIGANSVILSGVTIGRGAIVGAGSVVTKDVERYSVVVGNPARHLRYRFSPEAIRELESSQWWNWSVDEIKNNKAFFLRTFT